jgi:hypothetical protein
MSMFFDLDTAARFYNAVFFFFSFRSEELKHDDNVGKMILFNNVRQMS